MTFFIVAFSIYTLINVYLYWKGWRILRTSPALKGMYNAIFVFAYSAFVVAVLCRKYFPIALLKPLYLTGTVWLGAMFYLTLWFVGTDLLFLVARLYSKKINRGVRIARFICGYLLVIGLLVYGYQQFNQPVVVEKEIFITKPDIANRELKIVAFSDLHLGVQIDKKRLQQYVELINAQHPDLILFAGDMVDNHVFPLEKERMYEEINRLRAPMGIYACLGNHEYLSDIVPSTMFLKKTNMTLLVDEVARVSEGVWIIGRDDLQGNPNRLPLEELVQLADADQAIILLDHEPFDLSQAITNRIDLQVSGHTHDGQLWPLNLILKQMFELSHGYKLKGNSSIFVTSGLGLWGPPFRIATQSEILVIKVHFRTKD